MYKNTSLWRVGILSVVISTASGIALAAWVQPTELPPGGNTPPPINTGSTPQIKEGNFSLGVGSTFSATQGLFGKVGIGLTSTPTEPLEVSGKIKTDKIQLGEKWSLSGVGDFYADDSWLRLEDKGDKGYYGGFAAENLWAGNLLYGGSLILGGGWRFAPGGMYAGDDWIRLRYLVLFAHLPIAIIEGFVAGSAAAFIVRVNPDLLRSTWARSGVCPLHSSVVHP